ncbi:MAG: hypothetical protein WAL71_19005 [Terriglobales bacterium]|jgi:hypothetical protein
MKPHLTSLLVLPETKIVLDALATLLQKSPASVVDLTVSSYLASLPKTQRSAVETLKTVAMGNLDTARQPVDGMQPSATYQFSRLCFRRDIIEAIGQREAFRVVTPIGTFQMTKADFYREFQNVAESKSYSEDGIYHYPKVPKRAERYRIS